uniref:Chromatin assembly factor 1 subunit p150 C-terminal domain-containing protein n=1 Tax=Ciona savignyi TaxID=51511 RepID=H2ZDV5_CIOSA
MGDLIRLLHGSPHSSQRLVKEFQVYWEMKNTGSLLPQHGPLALTTTDSSDCSADLSKVGASLPSAPSPLKPPHSCLLSSSPPSQSASPAQSRVAGVDLLSQANKGEFWISKSQLTKKIKEIGAYGRKETLNRSCWFVLDAVFEKYSLDPRDYPVPSRWGYITHVPDISLVEL